MTRVPFRWKPTAEGLLFLSEEDLPTLSFPLEGVLEGFANPGFTLLEELWGEERVTEAPVGALLPYSEVYRLSPAERNILGIPEPDPSVRGQVHTSNWVNNDAFHIRMDCQQGTPGGVIQLLEEERTGPVFQTGDSVILVPESMWQVLEILDRGLPESVSDRFVHVARIQKAATPGMVALDAYLSNEAYVFPEAIGVEVEGISPDEIHLRATPEGIDESEFPGFALDERKSRTTYTARRGKRRRRLVLGPQDREAVDQLKDHRVLKGKDVPRFLANPEAYLPDGIDLSRFSPRVKGLIPIRYQSQPYLAIDKTAKRDWFAVTPQIELIPEPLPVEDPGGMRPFELDPGARSTGYSGPGKGEARDTTEPTPPIPPEEYRALCKEVADTGDPHVLHNGAWITIDPDRARSFLESWNQLEVDENGQLGIPRKKVSLILDVIPNTEVLEYVEERRQYHESPEVPEYPIPRTLNATLQPHQQIGYRWIRYLEERSLGGLLADDMGLGKTVQVIAFLTHLLEENRLAPTLLVVPKSLIQNWIREIRRFSPAIRLIYEHQGTARERNSHRIGLYEVVLTTYATLRRDQLLLGQVDWRAVICDEAQNVKNPTANVTAAIKGMKGLSRIAATGTPVENGLTELWCIMDFAQPGHLGSRREFRDLFERPIVEAGEGSPERLKAAETLHQRLVPHYVRRTKKDVMADLPEKSTRSYYLPLSERQAQLYGSVIRAIRRAETISIAGLQKLIQVCSHPRLLQPETGDVEASLADCPKLAATIDILAEIRDAKEKAVVFTRYKEMQRILQDSIRDRFGILPRVLNGDVAGENRLRIVDRFNDSPGFNVLILSPEAAGVGLNITGANHVIHYSRLWNPAKENQATDRVHRYGQTRPVTVHYPIVEGNGFRSVEEHLDQLLREKQSLAEDVLVPRDGLDLTAELAHRILQDDEKG